MNDQYSGNRFDSPSQDFGEGNDKDVNSPVENLDPYSGQSPRWMMRLLTRRLM